MIDYRPVKPNGEPKRSTSAALWRWFQSTRVFVGDRDALEWLVQNVREEEQRMCYGSKTFNRAVQKEAKRLAALDAAPGEVAEA